MLPPFWTRIEKAFTETVGHAFALHGQGINDYANGEEIDLVPWLQTTLTKAGFDFVITYGLADGITLATPDQKKTLGELVTLPGAGGNLPPVLAQYKDKAEKSTPNEVQFPKDPMQALGVLGQALSLSQRDKPDEVLSKYKVALIFPYAQNLFAASSAGYTPPQERILLEYAVNWARNPVWRGSGDAPLIFFIAPTLQALNPALAEAVYPVEVAAPDFDTRLAFIERALDANDITLADDLTPRRVAAITAGLLKVHIMDVIVGARINEVALTAELVNTRKKEIMATAYAGVLETKEATGSLDDVVGQDNLVRFLRKWVIDPMKKGESKGVPTGILLPGPAGTGKSYAAEKLAAEAGVNFVDFKMSNILGGIVGESERNLAKALAGIRALTPCIVFVDEIDQAFQRRTGGSNSVDSNIFQGVLTFMSRSELRGKVLWIAATNEPFDLDGALIRPGRIDAIIPVLPPEDDTARIAMFRAMARKHDITLSGMVDLSAAASQTDGYTGAEIEEVIRKAYTTACDNKHDTIEQADLEHAVKAIKGGSKDRQRRIQDALSVTRDRDFLPLRYREMALAQDTAEATPETPAQPARREKRSLNLEGVE